MQVVSIDPVSLIFLFAFLSLLPTFFILTTSFVKISTVCMLTRESLGTQQIPPNIVIYGLSLVLSFYIMGPVYNQAYNSISSQVQAGKTMTSQQLLSDMASCSQPIRDFLSKHTPSNEREFFLRSIHQYWPKEMAAQVRKDDFVILIPAFMITELTQAFKIGFLMYLPSVIIDIIISNILLAMGMMMMSPVVISTPLKLLLFIAVDGWSRLIHALLNTY